MIKTMRNLDVNGGEFMDKIAIRDRYYRSMIEEIVTMMPHYYQECCRHLQGNMVATMAVKRYDQQTLIPREMRFLLKQFCGVDHNSDNDTTTQGMLFLNSLLMYSKRPHKVNRPTKARILFPQKIAASLVEHIWREYRKKPLIELPEPLKSVESLLWILADLSSQIRRRGCLSVADACQAFSKMHQNKIFQYVGEGVSFYIDKAYKNDEYLIPVNKMYEKWLAEVETEYEKEQCEMVWQYLKALLGISSKMILASIAKRKLPEKARIEYEGFLGRAL